MSRFVDQVAVITGGSGTIGAVTAKKFLDEGSKVVLVDVDDETLRKVSAEINAGDDLAFVVADVTKNEDVAAYVKYALGTYGKIPVSFNNAGIEGVVQPIVDYPKEISDKVMAANVKGVFLGLKHVLPVISDGGATINTSPVAAFARGFAPSTSAYDHQQACGRGPHQRGRRRGRGSKPSCELDPSFAGNRPDDGISRGRNESRSTGVR